MSRNHLAIFLGMLLLAGLADDGFAQSNWPHLRGAGYDAFSTETGLVDSWPAGGPPVLWSIELGQGYSGFIVGGGRYSHNSSRRRRNTSWRSTPIQAPSFGERMLDRRGNRWARTRAA